MLRRAVMLTALLAACGDPDETIGGRPDAAALDAAPPDAPTYLVLGEICAEGGTFTRLFTRLIECNPAFETVVLQGRGAPATISDICASVFGPYVDDGSIAPAARAQLDACLAYLEDTPCVDVELATSTGPCDLLDGQVADGGDCEITDQCASASFCAPGATCGQCEARRGDGELCGADEECAGGACIGAQCGHLGADDEPCLDDDDCLGQRVCDGANHCVALRGWQVNDVCAPGTGDCDPLGTGLWCRDTGGGGPPAGQCAPMLDEGATCRSAGVDVGFCDVRAYLTCPAAATAQCAPPLVRAEDETCSLLAGEQCGAGLACTDVINGGTCIDYQGEDETCDAAGAETDQCDLFLTCAGTCVYSAYSGSCP